MLVVCSSDKRKIKNGDNKEVKFKSIYIISVNSFDIKKNSIK
jgi:hypothetical protein